MRPSCSLRSFHRQAEGAAIVEATVVIPFLILLMVGLIDFTLAYSSIAQAQKSLKSAARYLSKLPMSQLCDTTDNGGQKQAERLALYGDPAVTSGTTDMKNFKITLTPACTVPPSTTPVDTRINLTADVEYQAIAWRVLGFSGVVTIGTEHEERWIGQ